MGGKTRKEENGKYILPDVAASIREKVSAMGLDLKTDIAGAGLGVPGPVMPDGSVEVCVNLGWKNVNPQKELSALLDGIPVKSGNDANVAALGEMWQGGGKGYDNLVMITLGTGVGGGVILDQKIVAGRHGLAGEIGHIHVRDEERNTVTAAVRDVWSRSAPLRALQEKPEERWLPARRLPFSASTVTM